MLLLAQEGRIQLDAPAADYIAEFPHASTTVRHLLTHSAGLPGYDSLEPLANKTNADLLTEVRQRKLLPSFTPGSGFSYCNSCYNALALLIERVTGQPYVGFLHDQLKLPVEATLRPRALAKWHGRAIGCRPRPAGGLEPADSHDDEAFYGSANLSISAMALAEWGTRWWNHLTPMRTLATSSVSIANGVSGLSLGNWYCAPKRTRCHYLGHHQGFHHMLYWESRKRLSIALVSNNSMTGDFQQRIQRALLAFATQQPALGSAELANPLRPYAASPGVYRTLTDETVTLERGAGPFLRLVRRGVSYDVYPLGTGIGYAPGLDNYVTGTRAGQLHLLSLYEDELAEPVKGAP